MSSGQARSRPLWSLDLRHITITTLVQRAERGGHLTPRETRWHSRHGRLPAHRFRPFPMLFSLGPVAGRDGATEETLAFLGEARSMGLASSGARKVQKRDKHGAYHTTGHLPGV